MRFSRCTEVGTFTEAKVNFQTKLTLSSEALEAPIVFTQSTYNREEHEVEPPGTHKNPAPFRLMADSCTLDYRCEKLRWFERNFERTYSELRRTLQWGWSCEVSATMDSPDISDADLASLITLCPNLHPNKLVHFGKGSAFCEAVAERRSETTDLDLSRCVGVTDAAVSAIAVGCKQLQRLSLRDCVGVQGPGVMDLAQSCPALTSVDLTKTSVTDEAVVCSLVTNCPNLHPDAVKCRSEARGGGFLQMVTTHRPDISTIDLKNMVDITLDDVRALIDNCTKLVEIDLSGCSQLSKEQLEGIDATLKGRRDSLSAADTPTEVTGDTPTEITVEE